MTLKNIVLGPRHRALAAPLLAWRLFRAALAEKPDIVHLFKPKGYGGLAAMLLICCRRLGIRMPPLLLDTDDWEGRGGMNESQPYSLPEKWLFAFQEQWLIKRAIGVTVASRALESLAAELGAAPERVCYLPNCVDDSPPGDGLKVREKLGIPPEVPVVLLYTRFFEFSQEVLQRVFAAIHRLVPAARFLVVGRGARGEEKLLVAASLAEGFHDVLVMAGWVEPTELVDYLAAGDVAIYPFDDTLVNRAKCPAKLTELLRAATPVVANNVGQINEYIKPGVSGILCNPGDYLDMVNRVVMLLENPDLRRQMGNSGRKYLFDHFTWPRFASNLEKFYMTKGLFHE